MKVRCVKVGPIQTNCYIVEDDGHGKKPFCAVIDPGDDAQFITGLLDREPSHIIITHCHFDHIGALKALKRIFPDAVIAVGEHENHDPEHIAETAVSALGSFFYRYGMSDSFNGLPEPDIVYGWEQPKERRKPSPWPLQEIMRRLSLKPEQLLMVDDLKPGFDMAQAAHVPFAAACWAYDVPEIKAFMARFSEHCFDTPEDLEKFLFD